MKNRIVLTLILFIIVNGTIKAQILFTESFSVILDTTKTVKGNIVPDFKYQTQKKNLLEFENNADLTFRVKSNAVTFANKIELSKYGGETLLSGGYLYGEYRKIYEKKVTLEMFAQVHWAEARGMELKYAGGVNARWRILTRDNVGIFAGAGPFYEFERWNYEGVADTSLIPANTTPVENSNVKLGTYISFKYAGIKNIFLDLSLYHQSRFDEIFDTPRLASSSGITYSFTEHLGLSLIYQNIYDFSPVVPIDKLFHRVIFSLSISF